MGERIVITGSGIVAAPGVGQGPLQRALNEGGSGPREIKLFPTDSFPCRKAHEITDFDFRKHADDRRLRFVGRATRFLTVAAQSALENSSIDLSQIDASQVPVLVGTAFGTVGDLVEFEDHLSENPRAVDPVYFQNSVTSAPAGFLSLALGLSGPVMTVSAGLSSGLEALGQAIAYLRTERAQIVLVAGFESLCPYTYLGLINAGALSGSLQGQSESSAPFDRRRNGYFLGEGAAALVVERLDSALQRGVPIQAEIAGLQRAYAGRGKCNGRGADIDRGVLERTLAEAELSPNQLSYVSASANGSPLRDRAEASALQELLGASAELIPVTAVKSILGECGGASALLQISAAMLSMDSGWIPPITGLQEVEEGLGLKTTPAGAADCSVQAVLVDSLADEQHRSALVLKRYPDPQDEVTASHVANGL